MDISIVIINTNNREELQQCIESLSKSKNTPSFEVIIANNTPQEDLSEIQQTFSTIPIHIVEVHENRGYGYAANRGSEHAQGEIIIVSNPDILYNPTTLCDIWSHMQEHPTTGIASPLLLVPPNNTVQPFSFGKELTPGRMLMRKFLPTEQELLDRTAPGYMSVDWIAGTVVAIRTKLFREVKGFDEKIFLYFEDNDLCKRVQEHGQQIVLLHWSPVIHVGHSGESGKETRALSPKHKQWYYWAQRYYVSKHYGKAAALWIALLQAPKRLKQALRKNESHGK